MIGRFSKRTGAIAMAAVMVLTSLALAADQPTRQRAKLRAKVDLPTAAVAVMMPSKGNLVDGVLEFHQQSDGLHVTGKVSGLSPGLHGFHIHEYGDLRDGAGEFAGGHFNPGGHKHGGPETEERHAGDLGNIEAGQDGVAHVDMMAPWLKLHFVVGRSVVVHAGPDDLKSQPSGDSGPRVAVGVIGIADSTKVTSKKN